MAQPQRVKHTPIRMCVVCREKSAKRKLFRLARTDSGVQIDPTGKMNGRGAYVCDTPACWDRIIQSDVLGNALRMTLTAEDRERLRQAKPTT